MHAFVPNITMLYSNFIKSLFIKYPLTIPDSSPSNTLTVRSITYIYNT